MSLAETERYLAESGNGPAMVHAAPGNAPSDSHALAAAAAEDPKDTTGRVGAAQVGHDEDEVKDLGWQDHIERIPQPLVGGLPNEELWMLYRRFNKQVYHVKEIYEDPPGGLDLNIADKEEFSPDKLRVNLERLYMTVIIGAANAGKHVMRLRSWNEKKRSAVAFSLYFIAWAFNLLIPLFSATTILLIVYPPSRSYLFPPVPLALVDAKTGDLKKPAAGMLGSGDSLTGAPEKHPGEAVEQEASNFVNSFASIALASATGKHPEPKSQEDGKAIDAKVPDPTDLAMTAGAAKEASNGGTAHHDKTKKPVEEAMWEQIGPIMHILSNIADGWERFGNALSPTPPFPKHTARLKLASILVPVFLGSFFVTSEMMVKGLTFGIGAGFFGDPVTFRVLSFLDRKYPDWQKMLELRRTLLYGVPTNAQLTLTLLRIGEANKAPLPPPPRSDEPPSMEPKQITADDLPHTDASKAEVAEAVHPDEETLKEHDESTTKAEEKKPKHGSRILGFFKGTTKTGVTTGLGADRVRAKLGNEHAKNRLGIIPSTKSIGREGPVEFKCRFRGKKGVLRIHAASDIPSITFTYDGAKEREWMMAVNDVAELKKVGGLGWKGRLVVGWAMGREIADGLEIVDRRGDRWDVTALVLREELFNRLIAMGGQRWESL